MGYEKDVFLFEARDSLVKLEDSITKRSLLSLYAQFFYPMGLIAPFLIKPKVLFQELWLRGKPWDEKLDDDIAKEWSAWKKQLFNLKTLEIPRYVLPQEHEVHRIELHGFGDASEKVCGATIYLYAEDKVGKRISNLIMAKSRVPPTR